MSQEADSPGSAETATTTPAMPAPRRRRPLRFVLLVLVPLLAIAGAAWIYAVTGRYVTTENAYVKATKIAVSSDVDGRVVAVHVAENRRVEVGDLMIELDPRPWQIALAEADAEIARTRSQIEQLRVDHAASLAELEETKARISQLEAQVARYGNLSRRGVATSAKYEEVEADLLAARRRVATQVQRVRQALVAIGGDPDRAVEEHPLYRAATAARERVLLQLDHTRILAPTGGVISSLNLEPGEYVEEGKALFAIVDDSAPWIEANLKETQLTWILQGQEVEVTVDAYPGLTWTAAIDGIAPATGAEFAILPPQNASGNWVKVVQRIPVRLKLRPNPDRPPLRSGMTARVSIDTGRERELLTATRAAITGLQDPPAN